MASGDAWPSPGQFQQLKILVKARYAGLATGIDMANDYKNAFLALMYLRRRAAGPDPGRSLSYWSQVTSDWIEKMAIPGQTNPDALLAAAICHGIQFTGPKHGTLALTLGESSEPLPSSWRQVIETSRLPEPTVIKAPAPFLPGEVLIVGGDGKHVGRF